MTSDIEITGFGLAHIKEEGTPAHPDDIQVPEYLYSTERYKRWYARQLKAYNDYQNDKTSNNS